MKLIFLLFLGILICACLDGCDSGKAKVSNSTTGEYRGRYRGGFETITIKPDGTFHQEFRRPDKSLVYKVDGKWFLSRPNFIDFKPFIYNFNSSENELEKYQTLSVGSGKSELNPLRIEIGEWPYFVVKEKDISP